MKALTVFVWTLMGEYLIEQIILLHFPLLVLDNYQLFAIFLCMFAISLIVGVNEMENKNGKKE